MLADLRLPIGRFRCLVGTLLMLGIAGAPKAPFAQEWVFTTGIPCSTAPVYGLPFSQCWVSNVRNFRVGNVQAWRLLYSDSNSEVAVGFYKLVEAHGDSVRLIRPLIYVTENLSTEYARVQGFLPIACVCSEKESVRREIREFLDLMRSRHDGVSDSITAALGNVNLYTLFGENVPDSVCTEYEF